MTQNELKQAFMSLGITETGIVSATDGNKAINKDCSDLNQKTPICDISEILKGAKSIVVFLVPYNSGAEPENLSVYAAGRDYHKVCKEISDIISRKLAEEGFNSAGFADVGPLSERKLAQKAGLGIIGDNGFLINEKYGTYTFIGYIITDCPLKPSQSSKGECMKCGKCIASCPGQAFTPNSFDKDKCISYLTQKKGELSKEEVRLIKKGKSAWGCDICQKACPMNNKKAFTELPDFRENLILCIKNEYLSNNEFRKKYSDRAFSWRGKSVIERNLLILNDNVD